MPPGSKVNAKGGPELGKGGKGGHGGKGGFLDGKGKGEKGGKGGKPKGLNSHSEKVHFLSHFLIRILRHDNRVPDDGFLPIRPLPNSEFWSLEEIFSHEVDQEWNRDRWEAKNQILYRFADFAA